MSSFIKTVLSCSRESSREACADMPCLHGPWVHDGKRTDSKSGSTAYM